MVREDDLLEFAHHPRGRDDIAEPGCGHRPRLGERAHHHHRAVLVQERERGPVGELCVRLVHHNEARSHVHHSPHGRFGLHHTRGVVGRAHERDVRTVLGDDPLDLCRIDREVRTTLALHHGCTRQPGDVTVQLIGGLEGGHLATRTRVREQQGLQDLVRPVGGKDVLGADTVERPDSGTHLGGRTVWVAVPLDAGHLRSERLAPCRRRGFGRLIGVQTNPDVDLGRVISLEGA
ncbi:unannotated protein [freshwater metagenome]|uniref:Unannotated protein n=1 Tax=freshwater metagenome TaxID=449393 RepID=A0A6J7ERB6_9ZZZZ